MSRSVAGSGVLALALVMACSQQDSDAASATGTGAAAVAVAAAAAPMPPPERVEKTPQGELKNPYTDEDAAIVEEGKKLYMKAGCNGCHGGTAGGGMCPPITNDTWVYGGDDDTLFRLITIGSDELTKHGYSRKGRENVVGPMMPFGAIVKTDDDLWKIITFLRSNYRGGASSKYGRQPSPPPPQ